MDELEHPGTELADGHVLRPGDRIVADLENDIASERVKMVQGE